jgi:hypothetical protein
MSEHQYRGETVRRAAEIIDERIVPISHESADDANTGASRVHAAVEVLRVVNLESGR